MNIQCFPSSLQVPTVRERHEPLWSRGTFTTRLPQMEIFWRDFVCFLLIFFPCHFHILLFFIFCGCFGMISSRWGWGFRFVGFSHEVHEIRIILTESKCWRFSVFWTGLVLTSGPHAGSRETPHAEPKGLGWDQESVSALRWLQALVYSH